MFFSVWITHQSQKEIKLPRHTQKIPEWGVALTMEKTSLTEKHLFLDRYQTEHELWEALRHARKEKRTWRKLWLPHAEVAHSSTVETCKIIIARLKSIREWKKWDRQKKK